MHARGRRGGSTKDVTPQVQLSTHGPSHCPLWVTCCCQGCPWAQTWHEGCWPQCELCCSAQGKGQPKRWLKLIQMLPKISMFRISERATEPHNKKHTHKYITLFFPSWFCLKNRLTKKILNYHEKNLHGWPGEQTDEITFLKCRVAHWISMGNC